MVHYDEEHYEGLDVAHFDGEHDVVHYDEEENDA